MNQWSQNIGEILKFPSLSPRFLKKRRGYCNRLRPSVCPLCYLLLNRWTKFNQIWCVSYSHKWGVQQQIFFAPPPGALGRGQKVKYLISITKSISKFLYQTLSLFSQMKDTKHIRRDLILFPGSCPRGGT